MLDNYIFAREAVDRVRQRLYKSPLDSAKALEDMKIIRKSLKQLFKYMDKEYHK